MPKRPWNAALGLSVTLMLAACAPSPQTPIVTPLPQPDQALLQAQLPESPQDAELVDLPAAWVKGDPAGGFSTQQARALNLNYRYSRVGNQFFAFHRYGGQNRPVVVLRQGRPYRVVYVYLAPFYYPRYVPFYGQYTFPGQGRAIVTVVNHSYRPSVIRIPQNGRVTWYNNDPDPHTATGPLPGTVSTEGSWDVMLRPGQSGSKQFLIPGRHDYYCRIHPSMRGSVVVFATNVTP